MTQTEPTAPKKKSDLGPRLVTAAIGIPVLMGMLFYGPPIVFGVFLMAVSFVASWEYFSMTTGTQRRGLQVFTGLLTAALAALVYLRSDNGAALDGLEVVLAMCGAMMTLFIAHLLTFSDIKKTSLHIGSGAVGLIYCGLMPTTLSMLFRDAGQEGVFWVIMAMSVVWGSDTGAYFSGRAFGKNKLAPRVSPKKTLEGAAGGLLASILAVVLFKVTGWVSLEWWQVFALAIPANLLAQVGDLCESVIKRAHDIKDSGVIIYGHGGILDRADALIFAAPWFYAFHKYLAS
jgi:phosphatidate cytidylyltransferase